MMKSTFITGNSLKGLAGFVIFLFVSVTGTCLFAARVPVSTVAVYGPAVGNFHSKDTKLRINSYAPDGLMKVTYAITPADQEVKNWKNYTGWIPLEYLPGGSYKLSFYGTNDGGKNEEVKTYLFNMDRTAPSVELELSGKTHKVGKFSYIGVESTMKFNFEDPEGHYPQVYYRFTAEAWQKYEGRVFITPRGYHKNIDYYAVDSLGNKSEVKTYNFVIDYDAPKLVLKPNLPINRIHDQDFIPEGFIMEVVTKDDWAGVDTVMYSLNGAPMVEYKPISGFKEGANKLEFEVTDYVGHRYTSEHEFVKDTAHPAIAMVFNGPDGERVKEFTYSDGMVILESGSEMILLSKDSNSGVSGVFFDVNGHGFRKFNKTYPLTTVSDFKIDFFALDNVGNQSETRTASFRVIPR